MNRSANDSLQQIGRQLGRAWRWGRRALLAGLALGSGVLLLELVHLHELLARLHPLLAHVVTGTIVAAGGAFAGWVAWRWWSVPRAVTPPELPPPERGWTRAQRQAYLSFVRRFLARQRANPSLPEAARARIPELLALAAARRAESDAVALVRDVEAAIDRLLEPIDQKARQEVWQCASQVAVITAVNPSALLDVLITLLRNLELMARLATLYYGRPGLWGSARIARDVLAVAATAGIVDRVAESAGGVAGEMFGSWTARLAGPVGQGLTNGLLTVRLGDAAVLRCRSLRSRRVGIKPWSPVMWREMARRLASLVGDRLAPEVGRAFKDASRAAGARGRASFRGLVGALRTVWRRPAPGEEEMIDA